MMNQYPMSGATASEDINVTDAAAVTLSPPAGASSAWICFVATSTYTEDRSICNVTMNGVAPTTGTGMPYGNYDNLELINRQKLNAIKFISAEVGKTLKIKVWYFANSPQ